MKKNLKNKGYIAPFGTLKGERTTLPLRQRCKAVEQHCWKIVVWPSAISITCFCPSLLSCITEIILKYTGVLRLNSKMSKDLGCLKQQMPHNYERYAPHLWQPSTVPGKPNGSRARMCQLAASHQTNVQWQLKSGHLWNLCSSWWSSPCFFLNFRAYFR